MSFGPAPQKRHVFVLLEGLNPVPAAPGHGLAVQDEAVACPVREPANGASFTILLRNGMKTRNFSHRDAISSTIFRSLPRTRHYPVAPPDVAGPSAGMVTDRFRAASAVCASARSEASRRVKPELPGGSPAITDC